MAASEASNYAELSAIARMLASGIGSSCLSAACAAGGELSASPETSMRSTLASSLTSR